MRASPDDESEMPMASSARRVPDALGFVAAPGAAALEQRLHAAILQRAALRAEMDEALWEAGGVMCKDAQDALVPARDALRAGISRAPESLGMVKRARAEAQEAALAAARVTAPEPDARACDPSALLRNLPATAEEGGLPGGQALLQDVSKFWAARAQRCARALRLARRGAGASLAVREEGSWEEAAQQRNLQLLREEQEAAEHSLARLRAAATQDITAEDVAALARHEALQEEVAAPVHALVSLLRAQRRSATEKLSADAADMGARAMQVAVEKGRTEAVAAGVPFMVRTRAQLDARLAALASSEGLGKRTALAAQIDGGNASDVIVATGAHFAKVATKTAEVFAACTSAIEQSDAVCEWEAELSGAGGEEVPAQPDFYSDASMGLFTAATDTEGRPDFVLNSEMAFVGTSSHTDLASRCFARASRHSEALEEEADAFAIQVKAALDKAEAMARDASGVDDNKENDPVSPAPRSPSPSLCRSSIPSKQGGTHSPRIGRRVSLGAFLSAGQTVLQAVSDARARLDAVPENDGETGELPAVREDDDHDALLTQVTAAATLPASMLDAVHKLEACRARRGRAAVLHFANAGAALRAELVGAAPEGTVDESGEVVSHADVAIGVTRKPMMLKAGVTEAEAVDKSLVNLGSMLLRAEAERIAMSDRAAAGLAPDRMALVAALYALEGELATKRWELAWVYARLARGSTDSSHAAMLAARARGALRRKARVLLPVAPRASGRLDVKNWRSLDAVRAAYALECSAIGDEVTLVEALADKLERRELAARAAVHAALGSEPQRCGMPLPVCAAPGQAAVLGVDRMECLGHAVEVADALDALTSTVEGACECFGSGVRRAVAARALSLSTSATVEKGAASIAERRHALGVHAARLLSYKGASENGERSGIDLSAMSPHERLAAGSVVVGNPAVLDEAAAIASNTAAFPKGGSSAKAAAHLVRRLAQLRAVRLRRAVARSFIETNALSVAYCQQASAMGVLSGELDHAPIDIERSSSSTDESASKGGRMPLFGTAAAGRHAEHDGAEDDTHALRCTLTAEEIDPALPAVLDWCTASAAADVMTTHGYACRALACCASLQRAEAALLGAATSVNRLLIDEACRAGSRARVRSLLMASASDALGGRADSAHRAQLENEKYEAARRGAATTLAKELFVDVRAIKLALRQRIATELTQRRAAAAAAGDGVDETALRISLAGRYTALMHETAHSLQLAGQAAIAAGVLGRAALAAAAPCGTRRGAGGPYARGSDAEAHAVLTFAPPHTTRHTSLHHTAIPTIVHEEIEDLEAFARGAGAFTLPAPLSVLRAASMSPWEDVAAASALLTAQTALIETAAADAALMVKASDWTRIISGEAPFGTAPSANDAQAFAAGHRAAAAVGDVLDEVRKEVGAMGSYSSTEDLIAVILAKQRAMAVCRSAAMARVARAARYGDVGDTTTAFASVSSRHASTSQDGVDRRLAAAVCHCSRAAMSRVTRRRIVAFMGCEVDGCELLVGSLLTAPDWARRRVRVEASALLAERSDVLGRVVSAVDVSRGQRVRQPSGNSAAAIALRQELAAAGETFDSLLLSNVGLQYALPAEKYKAFQARAKEVLGCIQDWGTGMVVAFGDLAKAGPAEHMAAELCALKEAADEQLLDSMLFDLDSEINRLAAASAAQLRNARRAIAAGRGPLGEAEQIDVEACESGDYDGVDAAVGALTARLRACLAETSARRVEQFTVRGDELRRWMGDVARALAASRRRAAESGARDYQAQALQAARNARIARAEVVAVRSAGSADEDARRRLVEAAVADRGREVLEELERMTGKAERLSMDMDAAGERRVAAVRDELEGDLARLRGELLASKSNFEQYRTEMTRNSLTALAEVKNETLLKLASRDPERKFMTDAMAKSMELEQKVIHLQAEGAEQQRVLTKLQCLYRMRALHISAKLEGQKRGDLMRSNEEARKNWERRHAAEARATLMEQQLKGTVERLDAAEKSVATLAGEVASARRARDRLARWKLQAEREMDDMRAQLAAPGGRHGRNVRPSSARPASAARSLRPASAVSRGALRRPMSAPLRPWDEADSIREGQQGAAALAAGIGPRRSEVERLEKQLKNAEAKLAVERAARGRMQQESVHRRPWSARTPPASNAPAYNATGDGSNGASSSNSAGGRRVVRRPASARPRLVARRDLPEAAPAKLARPSSALPRERLPRAQFDFSI